MLVKSSLIALFQHRKLLLQLSRKDLKDKYLGSYLGILWAFIQPMATISVFWFIFQVGFRSVPVDNYPFILWLITGMLPWFCFSEGLMNATNSVVENRFLVKNVVFKVGLLPFVKLISPLIIHLTFLVVLIVMFLIYGYQPNVYFLQVFYYLFAMMMFLLGLSWITSALVIFLKDVGQILALCLQFGFWLTPIFWSMNIIPDKYVLLLKLNPMYYIVEGYRHSFIFRSWFWQYPTSTIYFWSVTIIVLIIGALVFKRLRPHFADVI
jgi:ABC-type polysaccharide/polyol phosphate export permease